MPGQAVRPPVMSLLLPTMSRTMEFSPARAQLGTAAVALSPTPVPYRVTRDAVRASVEQRRYKQIMELRLRHIPKPLPFPSAEVMARLKQADREVPDRSQQEALLEIETRLAYLTDPRMSRSEKEKSAENRKVRRLGRIWDIVSLTAERLKLITAHREGRLGYSVTLFLQSDLPGSYLANIGSATHWENAGLFISFNAEAQKLFHRVTGGPGEEATKPAFLASEASLREIETGFRAFDKRFSAVTASTDSVLGWRDALEYYVDLFSARTLPEFRTLRRISMTSLDRAAFDELSEGLRVATQSLRGILAREYPGGVSSYQWLASDDPFLSDFLRAELADA